MHGSRRARRSDAPRNRDHTSQPHEPGPTGSFVIHGRRPVLEALRKGVVRAIEISDSAHGPIIDKILQTAEIRRIHVQRVKDYIGSDSAVSQGVQAFATKPEIRGDLRAFVEQLAPQPLPLLLVLDGVTDPHNFGAILRTAEAAGVTAVVIRERRQVPVTDTVVKASAGAAYLVPIFQVPNLAQAARVLRERGFWLAAAVGETENVPLWDFDWDRPMALFVGAEGQGVSELLRNLVDDQIRIPMVGHISSLNVSVATGVLLFEAMKARLLKR
jgi:23S rRNA (guanosine2251-2'-O)-methyltransferase